MDEAAIIDGANPVQVFFIRDAAAGQTGVSGDRRAGLPGQLEQLRRHADYLNTTQLFPADLSIQFFQQSLSKDAPKWHYMMAMATNDAAPILLLFFMEQRYFIEGLNVGAVKG